MKDIKKKKFIYIAISVVIIIICIIVCFFMEKNQENAEYGIVENNSFIDSTKSEKESKKNEKIYVYIIGEVNNPGVIEACSGDRIKNIVDLAGGFTSEANVESVNLAYQVEDGQKIVIPNVNEKEDEDNKDYVTSGAGVNVIDEDLCGTKININKATQTELETLKGIGPSMANKIIEFRNKNGKFNDIEELKNVPGIGNSKYDAIKDDIVAR